eukprot:9502784-Pyramimonas_sp.AAC.1
MRVHARVATPPSGLLGVAPSRGIGLGGAFEPCRPVGFRAGEAYLALARGQRAGGANSVRWCP